MPGSIRSRYDIVAASTSDPAKTLSRWWPGSKERYYAVRRRRAQPGPFADLTRRVKYRMTEWPSTPRLCRAQPPRAPTTARSPRVVPCRAAAVRSSRGARVGGGVGRRERTAGDRDDRRRRRRALVHHLDVSRRAAAAGGGIERALFARRVFRARDQPAEHAGARRRREGDGAGGLRVADRRRGQSARCRGSRCVTACSKRRGRATARGKPFRTFTGDTRTSSSRISPSAWSSARAPPWRATRSG